VLRSRHGIDERLLDRLESPDGRHEVTDGAAYFRATTAYPWSVPPSRPSSPLP
jgi:hypothetical protein